MWAAATAVTITARKSSESDTPSSASLTNYLVVGLAGDFQQFTVYKGLATYTMFSTQLLIFNSVWGWCVFATNTALTASIIGRIL